MSIVVTPRLKILEKQLDPIPARAPPVERKTATRPGAKAEIRVTGTRLLGATWADARDPMRMMSTPAAIPAHGRRSGVKPGARSGAGFAEARRRPSEPTAPAIA